MPIKSCAHKDIRGKEYRITYDDLDFQKCPVCEIKEIAVKSAQNSLLCLTKCVRDYIQKRRRVVYEKTR